MSQFDELLSHDLLDTRVDSFDFPDPEQLRLTYERARLVCQQSGMSEPSGYPSLVLTIVRGNCRGCSQIETPFLGVLPSS